MKDDRHTKLELARLKYQKELEEGEKLVNGAALFYAVFLFAFLAFLAFSFARQENKKPSTSVDVYKTVNETKEHSVACSLEGEKK